MEFGWYRKPLVVSLACDCSPPSRSVRTGGKGARNDKRHSTRAGNRNADTTRVSYDRPARFRDVRRDHSAFGFETVNIFYTAKTSPRRVNPVSTLPFVRGRASIRGACSHGTARRVGRANDDNRSTRRDGLLWTRSLGRKAPAGRSSCHSFRARRPFPLCAAGHLVVRPGPPRTRVRPRPPRPQRPPLSFCSFQTENGIKQEQVGYQKAGPDGGPVAVIQGAVSYVDKDGQTVNTKYIADENGYQPFGPHLPTPPPVPVEIQESLRLLATLPSTPEPQYQWWRVVLYPSPHRRHTTTTATATTRRRPPVSAPTPLPRFSPLCRQRRIQ